MPTTTGEAGGVEFSCGSFTCFGWQIDVVWVVSQLGATTAFRRSLNAGTSSSKRANVWANISDCQPYASPSSTPRIPDAGQKNPRTTMHVGNGLPSGGTTEPNLSL